MGSVSVVTLAGFHALNYSIFHLASAYRERACRPTASCNERSRQRIQGYTATRHQREVGTGYYDEVAQVISSGHDIHTHRRLDRKAPVRRPPPLNAVSTGAEDSPRRRARWLVAN